jgi:23S rRNA (pseudouridine1915-N3)-methyltransferase
MKLHIITIGKPKLSYAKQGWEEYLGRLQRYHTVRVTHLADKYADDSSKIIETSGDSYRVGLIIEGEQLTSRQLAAFLDVRALEAKEVCFIIGGPDGLPALVQAAMDFQWSLGKLTLPHDLAMVNLAEALYRASTISAGTPYHH